MAGNGRRDVSLPDEAKRAYPRNQDGAHKARHTIALVTLADFRDSHPFLRCARQNSGQAVASVALSA